MRNETKKVKPTELEDVPHDLLAGHMVQHEWKLAKKHVVKKYRHNLKNPPKSPELFDTYSEDSRNDDEEQKPVTKSYTHWLNKRKSIKASKRFETNSDDLDVHENIFSNMDTSKKSI